MADPKTTILTYRQALASRYRFYGWTAGGFWMVCIAMRIWVNGTVFLESLFVTAGFIGLIYLAHIFTHRHAMLVALDRDVAGTPGHFEQYMQGQQTQWEKYAMVRLLAGTVLAGAMLFFILFTEGHHRWPQILAAWFIGYILAVAIKNWLNFSEQILLHDYQRIFRDQPSDMSD